MMKHDDVDDAKLKLLDLFEIWFWPRHMFHLYLFSRIQFTIRIVAQLGMKLDPNWIPRLTKAYGDCM